MLTRGVARISSRPIGAMVAQVWQAVGSFSLQLLAAWLLGLSGLGLLSLCLSIIFLATAVASGMVGDSLVILDRRDRAIRGGLQFWALVLAIASFTVALIVLPASGLLKPIEALLMSLALARSSSSSRPPGSSWPQCASGDLSSSTPPPWPAPWRSSGSGP